MDRIDLNQLIQEYHEKPYCISEKQKNYMMFLADTPNVFPVLSDILRKTISSWSDLTKEDVSNGINQLLSRKRCTMYQILIIKSLYTDLKEISQRLHREISTWEELSLRDFKFLLKSPERFHLIPKDHPLICDIDYEYGWQESNYCEHSKMYYLKFYNLMMLDYDNITLEELTNKLQQYTQFLFRIYRTYNGFHVFVMSHELPHNNEMILNLMKSFGCDPYYCLFSFKYGYKIRLSKKKDRNETFLCQYVTTIGDVSLEHEKCTELMQIHDDYIAKFK